jgi:hypothetical protein
VATHTAIQVQGLILTSAAINNPVVTNIPLWFHTSNAMHGMAPCMYAPFKELHQYNQEMGTLSYTPKALHSALDYYQVANKGTLIQDITTTITKGVHTIWLT